MERYQIPPPGAGPWSRARNWWLQMREFTGEPKLSYESAAARMIPLTVQEIHGKAESVGTHGTAGDGGLRFRLTLDGQTSISISRHDR
jgi:hypothetical protein